MASNTSNISESTPVRRGGKAISDEIRSRLIKAHETGLSYGQISELYDVKKDTVFAFAVLGSIQPNREVVQRGER